MPVYQSSESTAVFTGGLALSEGQETAYFSLSDDASSPFFSQTTTSGCRIHKIDLNSWKSTDDFGSFHDVHEELSHNEGFSCHSLQRHQSVLVGLGLNYEGSAPTPSGFLHTFDFTKKQPSHSLLLKSREHPIDLTSSAAERALYVVSRQEIPDNTVADQQHEEILEEKMELWSPLTTLPESPTSIQVSRLNETLQVEWTSTFTAMSEDTVASVMPSAIIAYSDFLIVAGSTSGQGDAFGSSSGTDMDGFITKLNLKDGSLRVQTTGPNTIRLGGSFDDWVLNVCFRPTMSSTGLEEDETSAGDEFLYLVGATNQSLLGGQQNQEHKIRGFVMKVNVHTLEQIWVTEFPKEYDNYVSHCYVAGESLFVGGVVKDGPIDGGSNTEAYGQSDIFVSRLHNNANEQGSTEGEIDWIRQIGSEGSEILSGLKLLGARGEILLFGQTDGSWFTENPSKSTQAVLCTMDEYDGNLARRSSASPTLQPTREEMPTRLPTHLPTVDESTSGLTTSSPTPGEQQMRKTPEPTIWLASVPTSSPVFIYVDNGHTKDESKPEVVENTASGKAQSAVNNGSPGGFLPGIGIDEPPPEEVWSQEESFPIDQGYGGFLDKIVASGSGFQSDIGSTYAGGMVYDFTRHSVYLTGSSYGHFGHQHDTDKAHSVAHCFLTHLQLVGHELEHFQADDEDEDHVQACNSIAQSFNELYVSGIEINDGKKSIYSILSHLQRTPSKPQWKPVENSWLQDEMTPIGYPVALAVDSSSEESVFVLNLQSSEMVLNGDFAARAHPDFPNFTPGGHIKFGEHFSLVLEHYHQSNDPTQAKLVTDWSTLLHAEESGSENFVVGSSVLESSDTVFVGGTTSGKVTHLSSKRTENGMDGFVIAVSKETGSIDETRTKRFDSLDHQHDWIMSICGSTEEASAIFVVGATMGSMNEMDIRANDGSIQPFVSRLDAKTLDIVWTQQLQVQDSGSASGYGCSWAESENSLYVAGVVKDGASMQRTDTTFCQSAGNDDIFAVRFASDTGKVQWIQQFGSSGHENLARNGGILTDMSGGPILYGDTTGELFRAKASYTSDVFVVTLDKADGAISMTIEQTRFVVRLGLLGLLVLLLFTSCCCYCLCKKRKTKLSSNAFAEEKVTFEDEIEQLVAVKRRDGELEMVSPTKLGLGRTTKSQKARRLEDFMPKYYSDNPGASRPGRTVV